MRRSDRNGMTMVEMLIAMAILGIILLLTSSGIIQSLQVNRLAQETANTQSKLRRITEIISQELRSAVLGGLVDFPVESGSNSISFILLDGNGGIQVTGGPSNGNGNGNGGPDWYNSAITSVYTSDSTALQELAGSPAIIINGNGDAVLIDEITHVPGSGDKVQHNTCQIPIDYTPNTRLFGASAIGFSFDPDTEVLYEHTFNVDGSLQIPFAYGLSRFEIVYEYETADGSLVERNEPYQNANGMPQPEYEQDGDRYRLMRLRLTLAGQSDDEEIEREYVAYIELTGIGNDRNGSAILTGFRPCNEPGNGNGNNGNNSNNGNGRRP